MAKLYGNIQLGDPQSVLGQELQRSNSVVIEAQQQFSSSHRRRDPAPGTALNRFTYYSSVEFTASQIRKLLQQLFPLRKLVLSQLTFFCHSGVTAPSGQMIKRGRRCFRLVDILPMATLLAVKEEGIPYKNVERLPTMIRDNAERIFGVGSRVLLAGYGEELSLQFPQDSWIGTTVSKFLDHENVAGEQLLFWSYDVGELAKQLLDIVQEESRLLRAA